MSAPITVQITVPVTAPIVPSMTVPVSTLGNAPNDSSISSATESATSGAATPGDGLDGAAELLPAAADGDDEIPEPGTGSASGVGQVCAAAQASPQVIAWRDVLALVLPDAEEAIQTIARRACAAAQEGPKAGAPKVPTVGPTHPQGSKPSHPAHPGKPSAPNQPAQPPRPGTQQDDQGDDQGDDRGGKAEPKGTSADGPEAAPAPQGGGSNDRSGSGSGDDSGNSRGGSSNDQPGSAGQQRPSPADNSSSQNSDTDR